MFGMIAEISGMLFASAMAGKLAGRGAQILGQIGMRATKKGAPKILLNIAKNGSEGVVKQFVRHAGTGSHVFTPSQLMRQVVHGRRAGMAMSRLARSYAGYETVNALAWAIPGMHLGNQVLGGVGDLFAKTPKPSEQLMQANYLAMPRAAYTMRSRALQAIHSSQMGTRASLGDEASLMHR